MPNVCALLAGYDDLEIVDKEQIANVIYTVEEHRRLTKERGYTQQVIDEWVGQIKLIYK